MFNEQEVLSYMNIPRLSAIIALLLALSVSCAYCADIIYVKTNMGDSSPVFESVFREKLEADGHNIIDTSFEDLQDKLGNCTDGGHILVLSDAKVFPIDAKELLVRFLESKNSLLCISGPPFSDMVYNDNGQYLTKDETLHKLANEAGNTVIDISKQNISDWGRYTGSPETNTKYTPGHSSDPEGNPALNVAIDTLKDYEMLGTQALQDPFGNGAEATVFWARGWRNTKQLSVEWQEKDGSRWMTVIDISNNGKQFALLPEDFKFWGGNDKRGGKNDSFKPENATVFMVGVASGITDQPLGEAQGYWISNVRTVQSKYADIDFSQPVIETISPYYKLNTTTTSHLLNRDGDRIDYSGSVMSPIPRPTGVYGDSPPDIRYLPVLQVVDEEDRAVGSAAHLSLFNRGDFEGSIVGMVGITQKDLEAHTEMFAGAACDIVNKMSSRKLLKHGGAIKAAFEDGEDVSFYSESLVSTLQSVRYEYDRVSEENPAGTVEYDKAGTHSSVGPLMPGLYNVQTALLDGENVVDSIKQTLRVVNNREIDPKSIVTVKGRDFYLGDKKWYPYGVNYWPRYSTGYEKGGKGLGWLEPDMYDPRIVEQDLAEIADLGLNHVSIQYKKESEAPAVQDFLARCEAHDIKVFIYVPGLNPVELDLGYARRLIEKARLQHSNAIFAYDLGWEVHVGGHGRRTKFNDIWQKWTIDMYGTLENAYRDWGYTPPLDDNGFLDNPTNEQLLVDGAWRVYVAAYRRFWDDEIGKRYKKVRDFVKSIDPHHLMGARSGYGGTGTMKYAPDFPFDLASGAYHLDFISPEAYPKEGGREEIYELGIVTAYAQMVGRNKPVYWSEIGKTVWPNNKKTYAAQKDMYNYAIDMMLMTCSNGVCVWWWPGGFRAAEESDFGIVSPDLATRPAAELMNQRRTAFTSVRNPVVPSEIFVVDRDKHVSGFAGIVEDHAKDFAALLKQNKVAELRTPAFNTNSANTPLVAVGNVPCTGSNPPKYLNSEFQKVVVNGKEVKNGGSVRLGKGAFITLDVVVLNTAEALWLCEDVNRIVSVSLSYASGNKKMHVTIPQDTAYLNTVELRKVFCGKLNAPEKIFELRMSAKQRSDFGQVFRFTVVAE